MGIKFSSKLGRAKLRYGLPHDSPHSARLATAFLQSIKHNPHVNNSTVINNSNMWLNSVYKRYASQVR